MTKQNYDYKAKSIVSDHGLGEPIAEVLGVSGRLTHRTRKDSQKAPLWFKQRFVTNWKEYREDGQTYRIQTELSHGPESTTFCFKIPLL